MKTLSIVVITILGLIVGVVALIMWTTAPISSAGNAFFDAWSAGQPQRSYPYLSHSFKQSNSAERLHQFMADNRLNSGVTTSWSNRSFKNSVGKLTGELTRADGSVMQVNIDLVKENDLWKISGMHFTTPIPGPTQIATNNGYAPTNQYNGGQAQTRTNKDNSFENETTAVSPSLSVISVSASNSAP